MMKETDPEPWPDLDLTIARGEGGHVAVENIELLLKFAQDTVKSQVEGGRLLIARCYAVLSQASTLTAAAIGGVGISSGTGPTHGWTGHLSVLIGFTVAAILWAISAAIAIHTLTPTTFGGAALHIRDAYTPSRLTGDVRQLDLDVIQLLDTAIAENTPKIASMRSHLKWALRLIALAPVAGALTAVTLNIARRLFLPW